MHTYFEMADPIKESNISSLAADFGNSFHRLNIFWKTLKTAHWKNTIAKRVTEGISAVLTCIPELM